MYLYKSITGKTVCIDSYVITVDPGLELKYASDVLDTYMGTQLSRYTNGVLDTTDIETPSTLLQDSLVLKGTNVVGVKVDKASPSFGWRDLMGDIIPKTSGVGSPALGVISGSLRGYHYSVGEDGDCIYHIPHDYVAGSNLYSHIHWLHNGTNISGDFNINISASYAKGHNQQEFPAEKTLVLADTGLNITNTPRLRHKLTEIQLSTVGGSATLLNTSEIEADGIIIIHYDVSSIPTITGGTGKPFILTFDIHYQSTNVATKNKSPNFYLQS